MFNCKTCDQIGLKYNSNVACKATLSEILIISIIQRDMNRTEERPELC